MSTPSPEKARQAQLATLLLLGLLTLLMALETMALAPPTVQTPAVLFVMTLKLLPLLFFFWPIHRGRPMSAVWLGFLLMLYFCWAVLGVFEPGLAGKLATAKAVLIGACFVSAMLFTRWQRAVLESPVTDSEA